MKRGVHPHHLALWAHHGGDLLGHVAEAAAHVKNPFARLRRMQCERAVALGAIAGKDQVPELREAVEQDTVPGLDRLLVGCRDLGFHWAMIDPRSLAH